MRSYEVVIGRGEGEITAHIPANSPRDAVKLALEMDSHDEPSSLDDINRGVLVGGIFVREFGPNE